MKHSTCRGHPIIWEGPDDGGGWVYEDTRKALPDRGGKLRQCPKCGALGQGDVDPCLGVLPGVDSACCGHGDRDESYIRFTTGVAIKGFIVDASALGNAVSPGNDGKDGGKA